MIRILLLLIALFSLSFCEEPSNQALSDLLSFLRDRSYPYNWELYLLTCFPYFKGQEHPWASECEGNYNSTLEKEGIVCTTKEGICYIGSKALIQADSIYLYRAEKYMYYYQKWSFLQEHIIVTDLSDKIINVFTRETPDGPLQKVNLRY